jgi:hypothetical protein
MDHLESLPQLPPGPSQGREVERSGHELAGFCYNYLRRNLSVAVVSIATVVAANAILGVSLLEAQEPSGQQTGGSESNRGQGRWKKFRKNSVVGTRKADALTEKQIEQIRQLEALGYVEGVSAAPVASGVTVNLRDRTWPGLNFYVSGHGPEATLIDMEGTVLHTWSFEFQDAFPGMSTDHPHWRRAYLYKNGDILALWEGRGLIRLDKDSRLRWKYDRKPHHDMFVTDQGNIYVLSRKAGLVPLIHESHPVMENSIDLLDASGRLLKRTSILECYQNSEYGPAMIQRLRELIEHRLETEKRLPGDIFHTNTITMLDGRLESSSPIFKQGNLLISLRNPSVLAIIDPEKEQVVWSTTGIWKHQHDPILLDNGRMLLFDNEGQKKSSRILEFDPFSLEIFWMFDGQPPGKFHSRCCGTVQRLPNGNTLTAETDNGRALEVAPDGTVVWEYISPYRAGKDNQLIAALFDMIRIPRDWKLDWLDNRHHARRGSASMR